MSNAIFFTILLQSPYFPKKQPYQSTHFISSSNQLHLQISKTILSMPKRSVLHVLLYVIIKNNNKKTVQGQYVSQITALLEKSIK